MQPVNGSGSQDRQALERRIDLLQDDLRTRDRKIGELERLVERQLAMLERYERASGRMANADRPATPARQLSHEEYGRLIELLDRAIARAEQLTRDKQRLENNLDQTLGMLDTALKQQERVAGTFAPGTAGYADQAANAGGMEAGAASSMEATLARYDAMLERSLASLEKAYQANREQEKQIAERDRLLDRTMKALQNAVDDEALKPREPRRRGLGRLFG